MRDLSARSVRRSPLHLKTAEACVSDKWIRACGFTVPLVYTNEREECEALSARAGLADISARHCWRIDGPDAVAFLGFATTHDAALIEAGQTTRVLWCDDSGFVRGEGGLSRIGSRCFELTSVVDDFAWFADGAIGFDVSVSDWTGQRGGLALRGPNAEAILALAGFGASSGTDPVKGPTTSDAAEQGQILLLRAADGVELWMDAAGLGLVWDRLMRVGAGFGLQPIGAGVLSLDRIEAALPQPGVDWVPAQFALRQADLRVPLDLGVEPGLMRRFNGVEALLARRQGCGSKLVQLRSSKPIPLAEVIGKGGSAGHVTSAASSPATGRHLALAWIKDEFARPGAMLARPATSGALDIQIARLCHS
jgi:aminomethyltransferase